VVENVCNINFGVLRYPLIDIRHRGSAFGIEFPVTADVTKLCLSRSWKYSTYDSDYALAMSVIGIFLRYRFSILTREDSISSWRVVGCEALAGSKHYT
jgi:hypothetical protein